MHNKICIVTGAAQGIGRKVVELFSQAGAAKIYACDIKHGNNEKFKNVIPVTLNVCDRLAIQEAVSKIQQQDGRIDVLVNNAGITRDNLINKMTEQDWDLVIDINLKGVFNMTQAVAPVMMEFNAGSIITMSSVVGTDGNIGQSNYAATKGGVIAMTKGWAKEFARKGAKVRANCVAPGFVVTPMTKDLPEKVIAHMVAKTPLGRMATAEDIANGVLFLASEKSSFITGQTLKIDGGLVI
ncbi:SDR family oxidoreductase [Salmonella enterica subsp. salamae]|uniref:SDR family oxidoreductase n=1 Tax=Salmonella enterica TaxID=28901 RepID=A0A5V4Z5F1_SALER|nr:SDR family oxidoreductase [Salmonella enterica]ECH9563354.1 SDR family oxidoreductase [Salmonella enterica subsp. salamae]ECI4612540.1 beta-ketoacyl-ACP reductase [Salmonella enterica subsp. diarizonae]EDX3148122.1 SDR family oxidoreductase [Salmonella enterica subsp. diarizonae serovar 61:l,v:1,5,7]EBI0310357.1 SDR family oxidoreductase [Salmonella enterica]